MSLTGKVALVTGGAQGLGKAFAVELLKAGANVALVDVKHEEGESTRKTLQETFGIDRVIFFLGNVTSQESFEGAFQSAKKQFGGLDIVINNAGVGGEKPGFWERTIDINVNGTIRGTLLGIDNLRRDRGGRGGVIVNVSSVAGLNPNPCSPAYCASKSAVIQYSLSWAKHPELVENDVRINVLAPSFADTPLVTSLRSGDMALLPQMSKVIIESAGIMTVEAVAESLMELVDDGQGKNGAVLKITKNGGKSYQ